MNFAPTHPINTSTAFVGKWKKNEYISFSWNNRQKNYLNMVQTFQQQQQGEKPTAKSGEELRRVRAFQLPEIQQAG